MPSGDKLHLNDLCAVVKHSAECIALSTTAVPSKQFEHRAYQYSYRKEGFRIVRRLVSARLCRFYKLGRGDHQILFEFSIQFRVVLSLFYFLGL